MRIGAAMLRIDVEPEQAVDFKCYRRLGKAVLQQAFFEAEVPRVCFRCGKKSPTALADLRNELRKAMRGRKEAIDFLEHRANMWCAAARIDVGDVRKAVEEHKLVRRRVCGCPRSLRDKECKDWWSL